MHRWMRCHKRMNLQQNSSNFHYQCRIIFFIFNYYCPTKIVERFTGFGLTYPMVSFGEVWPDQ